MSVHDRGKVWLLVAIAGVMLLGGTPAVRPPIVEPVAAPARGLDASAVSALILDVNPLLSTYEADRIGDSVVRYSTKYGLDAEIVTAVVLVESSARPWAKSPKGARGLMQVMPYMARPLGMVGNLNTIESNIEAGCVILAGNIRRLGEKDGISAYFWGSNIRGVAYWNRIEAARERVRHFLAS
jgi:hypothetical protein